MIAMLRDTKVDYITDQLPMVFAGWTPVEIPADTPVEPGWHYINGQWLDSDGAAPIVAGMSLAAARTAASLRIDARAEELRNQVLTPGSGQMAAYQRKEAQARSFLEDAAPDAARYPAVYGEVGITAETAEDVARVIIAKADAWWAYGDALEKVRLAGKRDVEAAADPAGVATAEAAMVWPAAPAA